MSTRMLIDARHREETRVAVVKGNRIEEFDFEAADRKQLKGNIYLAKVTRVEPSLQAAFIEYGGNRHGFLAFSEIHPDYYQIPKEDRDALLREEEALDQEMLEHAQAEEAESGISGGGDDVEDDAEDDGIDDDPDAGDEDGDAVAAADEGSGASVASKSAGSADEDRASDEQASDAMRQRRMALRRRYKIQEVIRRRQVLLVQVVKEERGNKGAALTTYLSLAGRYCVLMPNTSHGGGISRKISSPADRRRLKSIMTELNLPTGMGCIVRTAGLQRTRAEIKRDFEYLTRLWDEIRTATLESTAPALIYEDNDLVKRAIRDIYTREISEVLVDGERGYKSAKTFMRLLMPSHAKKVQPYAHPVPLFQRFQVEGQLAAMFEPSVQLKSGGYIVINPTEALVAIDINSGRSTREHNVEETALKTNLEAADEIARQLRLRDMAGLIVIDFIDMESSGNARKVERQMKEALKNDRARIQIGRISGFGLMEMSRQRLCTGVLEASTHICPMCDGAGIVRTLPSASLTALRGLETDALKGRASNFLLRVPTQVAVYILNEKRAELVELEQRYAIEIEVVPDGSLLIPNYAVDASGEPPERIPAFEEVAAPAVEEEDFVEEDEVEDEELEADEEVETASAEPPRQQRDREPRQDGEREGGRRRRRRRRRRGENGRSNGEVEDESGSEAGEVSAEAGAGEPDEVEAQVEAEPDSGDELSPEGSERPDARDEPRSRRRGRRGGRRNAERRSRTAEGDAPQAAEMSEGDDRPFEAEGSDGEDERAVPVMGEESLPEIVPAEAIAEEMVEAEADQPGAGQPEAEAPAKPARSRAPRAPRAAKPRRPRKPKAEADAEAETVEAVAQENGTPEQALPGDAPAEAAARPEAAVAEARTEEEPAATGPQAGGDDLALASVSEAQQSDDRPVRRGWWQRTFGG